jgi:hypothetical protein
MTRTLVPLETMNARPRVTIVSSPLVSLAKALFISSSDAGRSTATRTNRDPPDNSPVFPAAQPRSSPVTAARDTPPTVKDIKKIRRVAIERWSNAFTNYAVRPSSFGVSRAETVGPLRGRPTLRRCSLESSCESRRDNAALFGERGSLQDQVLAVPSDLESREGGKKCGFIE